VITGQPTVHEGRQAIEHSFVDGTVPVVMTGGVVVLLGFVALLPAMAFLARTLGRRTEAGRWAAQSAAAAGVGRRTARPRPAHRVQAGRVDHPTQLVVRDRTQAALRMRGL
jgi:hypothetical protein